MMPNHNNNFGLYFFLFIFICLIALYLTRWGMMYDFKTSGDEWYKIVFLNYSLWTKDDIKNKCPVVKTPKSDDDNAPAPKSDDDNAPEADTQ